MSLWDNCYSLNCILWTLPVANLFFESGCWLASFTSSTERGFSQFIDNISRTGRYSDDMFVKESGNVVFRILLVMGVRILESWNGTAIFFLFEFSSESFSIVYLHLGSYRFSLCHTSQFGNTWLWEGYVLCLECHATQENYDSAFLRPRSSNPFAK